MKKVICMVIMICAIVALIGACVSVANMVEGEEVVDMTETSELDIAIAAFKNAVGTLANILDAETIELVKA